MKKYAQRVSQFILDDLLIKAGEIKKLETLPSSQIIEAASKARSWLNKETGLSWLFEPIPDNIFTFEYGPGIELRKETSKIPMLFGGDFGDSKSNLRQKIGDGKKNEWKDDTVKEHLKEMYGEKAEEIATEFKLAYPDKKPADVLFIDRKARYKNLEAAKAHALRGGKAWNWLFAAEFPINGGTVPWHCCDTCYITHNALYQEAAYIPGLSERLQDEICAAFTAFAEKGDPNSSLLPRWPPITGDQMPTMIFDYHNRMVINHDAKLQKLLEDWYEDN
jgi:para-nitrobenzyl esterase